MSGLCGWFDPAGGGPPDPQVIAAMAAAFTRFDGSTIRTASAGFGAVAVAALGGDVDVHQSDEQLVAVWGHARFSDIELAESARQHGVAHALAQGYSRKRTDVFASLSGTFALAILNGDRGETVLAIDRMGVRPLCYTVTGGRLLFGSTLDAINGFPSVKADINRQALYDYVHFHMEPAPQTAYAERTRLLPGTFARWRKGQVESQPYWEMRYTEDDARPFPELKEKFLGLLRESIRDAAGQRVTGTFLSGGTDSSTIAGLLGEVTGEPARTYSIGFEATGYDEMKYARIAARHFGTRHHEYYVTPDDVVNAIPRIAAIHDQPFGNSSAVPTYYCAELARQDGVLTLLGGDGGDELFGGNERYAIQYLYSLYSDLPKSLRKGLIEPVAFFPPEVGIVGKVQRYITHASLPMPARYDHYNLLERLGPAVVFTRDFLATVDPQLPLAQVGQSYHSAHAHSLVNRMLALDLKYTLADNDLPKVTRSCEVAGVDVRFPLLCDEMVSFSAQLAPGLKLKRTKLRFFFKEALRGFLPDEIIAKTKHGFGLPFGPWLKTHRLLQQLALDSLADLKKRPIVRPEFIDELTSIRIKTHADYYGTMVWILMMLEQWLKQHRSMV
jgi:asparagine synthase (glutamine-hydrolysing)